MAELQTLLVAALGGLPLIELGLMVMASPWNERLAGAPARDREVAADDRSRFLGGAFVLLGLLVMLLLRGVAASA